MPKQFSHDTRTLISQLKSCDDASIAGKLSDRDLDCSWGVDVVGQLKGYDRSGYLSTRFFVALEALFKDYEKARTLPLGFWGLEYVSLVCSEAENNLRWHTTFECDLWEPQMPFVQYDDVIGGSPNEVLYRWRNLKDGERLVSVPFYAEGFNAHLVLKVRARRYDMTTA